MPSTNCIPSLQLSLRRAGVIGFWMLVTTLASLALGLGSLAVGGGSPWAWAAGGAVCALLPGVFWCPWFETGVRAWNWALRLSAGAIRTYALAVFYYVLFVAVGRVGSLMAHSGRPPGDSDWASRPAHGVQVGDLESVPLEQVRWLGELDGLSRRPGNGWVVFLLPLVVLLRVFRDEHADSAPPSATYTLY